MLIVALDGEADLVFGGDCGREGENEEEEQCLEEGTSHAYIIMERIFPWYEY